MNIINFRNHLGLWILGLCNNYSYVIMLSAAVDLLNQHSQNDPSIDLDPISDNSTFCASTSTGAILIADILPCLLIKMMLPFIAINTHIRVFTAIFLSAASFILTAFSHASYMTYLGVVSASFSSGLGETTFLGYTSEFSNKALVSSWSSGTGAAGVFGALSYAALRQSKISLRTSLLLMLTAPILMALSFWVLISPPKVICVQSTDHSKLHNNSQFSSQSSIVPVTETHEEKLNKTKLFKGLLKYMIPLTLVYFLEYVINQGLFELTYFPGIWLSHFDQYRWYCVDYQLSVLISRSSIKWVKIKRLWILPIIQAINLVLILVHIIKPYFSSVFVMLIVVFIEGLVGGGAYVNTFDRIYEKNTGRARKFSLEVTVIGDALGIALAGITAIYIHNILCEYILSHYH